MGSRLLWAKTLDFASLADHMVHHNKQKRWRCNLSTKIDDILLIEWRWICWGWGRQCYNTEVDDITVKKTKTKTKMMMKGLSCSFGYLLIAWSPKSFTKQCNVVPAITFDPTWGIKQKEVLPFDMLIRVLLTTSQRKTRPKNIEEKCRAMLLRRIRANTVACRCTK